MKSLIMVLLASIVASLGACASHEAHPISRVHHAVFFTLQSPDDAPELIADCGLLALLPGVTHIGAGRPVDIGRTNVDGNYDVGFHIAFDSIASYRGYLSHPVHTRLVEKWRPRWRGIVIHDFGVP